MPIALIATAIAVRIFLNYAPEETRSVLVTQLPLIFRVLDSSYLVNDPYVNEMQGFSVRTIPTYVAAGLASLVGLDGALLLQHVVTLVAATTAAFLIVRSLGGSPMSGIAVTAILLFSDGGWFGNVLTITDGEAPGETAKAFALLAVALSIANRWKATAVVLLLALCFQAAYGIWAGMIIAITHGVCRFARPLLARIFLTAGAIVVVLGLAALVEAWTLGPADDLVKIIANFRNPHHLLWTAIKSEFYPNVIAVAFGALVSLALIGRSRVEPQRALQVWSGVLATSFCGFMLVEPFATRLGLAIQGGRLLYIVYALAVAGVVVLMEGTLKGWLPRFYCEIELLLSRIGDNRHAQIASCAVAVIAALILALPLFSQRAARLGEQYAYKPILSHKDRWQEEDLRHDDAVAIAQAMRRLSSDALILAPPDFGLVRTVARRALFADFRAWSFPAPKAWAARMAAAYGPLDEPGGFPWLERAVEKWAATDCGELMARARRLGATHVVVEGGRSDCPAIISAGRFRLLATEARITAQP